jgi:lysophospholipase L1-like esterase
MSSPSSSTSTWGEHRLIEASVTGPTLEETLSAEIDAFIKADREAMPKPYQVLFVGSSSFARWKTIKDDMAPASIINRGIGGAHIEHVNRRFDQLVAPYYPRAIVFYAGENDIAEGKPVQRVLDDFAEFLRKKTDLLGPAPVYFISLKPSKFRLWQLPIQNAVNKGVQLCAKRRMDLHLVDVASLMLHDGKPKDVFVDDDLHMNAQGYAIWAKAVKDAIEPSIHESSPRGG